MQPRGCVVCKGGCREKGLQGDRVMTIVVITMPAALNVNWDAIRIEFAHGEGLEALAKKYNVAFGTLAARSSRERWMELRPQSHAKGLQSPVLEAGKAVAKSVAESWAEKGEKYRTMVFGKTTAMMEQATLAPPKNWKDADIVDKMARRAAGLDNLETQVNTIIGIGSLDDGPIMADFESEIVPSVSLPEGSVEGEATG